MASECGKQKALFGFPYERQEFVFTIQKTHFVQNEAGSAVVNINDEDNSVKLYGVSSVTLGCRSQYPSSYTLVGPYLNWIKMTANLKTLT
ncbi:Hypothetical predicted protein [Cloeon dipterum]|uniref:Peptidase S1 domain-containing protein n=1 Tax=Cloeon dipterum TaxID=197152 RepID=A0A8S1CZB3_9INSE|nr:Hypothetical predicted protein [Cloeon dipterum]